MNGAVRATSQGTFSHSLFVSEETIAQEEEVIHSRLELINEAEISAQLS